MLPAVSLFLQSNTEQWGLHFALNRAAVHWCWVAAHLYEEQTSKGVTAPNLLILELLSYPQTLVSSFDLQVPSSGDPIIAYRLKFLLVHGSTVSPSGPYCTSSSSSLVYCNAVGFCLLPDICVAQCCDIFGISWLILFYVFKHAMSV